jgi:hypothetical protein
MARATTVRHDEARLRSLPWGEVMIAGLGAGMAGGVLMALGGMVHAAIVGLDVLFPLRMVGATLVGPAALVGGAAAVAYGFALQMLVSMGLGVAFAALVNHTTTAGPALVGGTAFALASMLVLGAVVVPLVNPQMAVRLPTMPYAWFAQNLLFGLGLALAPNLRRHIASPLDPS